jgi:thiol-disulfide isomerase/thioredoxin
MNGVTPDSPIQISETKNDCVTAGTGVDWNDNIADFQLQNCAGDYVKLHSFCGKKAIWIAAVAGWCGACASLAPQMQKAQDDYGSIGLQVMLVLGENAYGNAPNLAYCKQWAKDHQVDPVNVYLDNTGGAGWATLFNKINTYTGTTITLPFSIVLDGSNMEYTWCDSSSNGDLSSALNALLN